MDDIEEKLLAMSDKYLCTTEETAARDTVHLLKQLGWPTVTTHTLSSLMATSPEEFDELVERAIKELQENPPEPNSIFRRKLSARDVKISILGPHERDYSLVRGKIEQNLFFQIFFQIYFLEVDREINGYKEAPLDSEDPASPTSEAPPRETFSIVNTWGTYMTELRHKKRKQELEKEKVAWLQERQRARKSPSASET